MREYCQGGVFLGILWFRFLLYRCPFNSRQLLTRLPPPRNQHFTVSVITFTALHHGAKAEPMESRVTDLLKNDRNF